ncbi:hypothetical protein VZQ01_23810 [Myxococcus faecalis]|uniref:hypothetical protein n=1 Tax=Myxococcus faecalis TaxID=3115646 RepID=UPI003CE964EC
MLALHAAGPKSYNELGPRAQPPIDTQGLEADRPELTADHPESEADRPGLPPDLAPSVMVAEGRLRRLFPGEPTHPNQAYAAASDDDERIPT